MASQFMCILSRGSCNLHAKLERAGFEGAVALVWSCVSLCSSRTLLGCTKLGLDSPELSRIEGEAEEMWGRT